MPEQLLIDWTLDARDALECRVLGILYAHHGRASAISVPDLTQWAVGVDYICAGASGRKTAERTIQKAVKRLREERGQPILSSSGRPPGYYLANTAAEVADCVREQRRKAIHTLTMLRALRRHLARLNGQLAITVEAQRVSNG
jgi:hypothetical protein